jgi:acetyltransferase-like isoleucine patch superfamily enzyme
MIELTGDVQIFDEVEISRNVEIVTHKHHWNHSRGLRKEIQEIEVVNLSILHDAFIGVGSILIGVAKIGEGAIIGAGSVVTTKEIPPFEVYGGNPAKKIGERKDAVQ